MGQVGQQVAPTFNSASDTHFGMRSRIYEIIKIYIVSYTKIACCFSKDSQKFRGILSYCGSLLYTLYALY